MTNQRIGGWKVRHVAAAVKPAPAIAHCPASLPSAAPTCGYCRQPARLSSGGEVYHYLPELRYRSVWVCRPCAASVMCHEGTAKPMGTLAKRDLRGLRKAAHELFDPLWAGCPRLRERAYRWLASEMGLTREETHFGLFDEARCWQAITILRTRAKANTLAYATS
jgi:hypothetical protein